jgi:hypothetical protein
MAASRLELDTVPRKDPVFQSIVDRFEEGLTRLEAIKYWTSQMNSGDGATMMETEEGSSPSRRRLQQEVCGCRVSVA